MSEYIEKEHIEAMIYEAIDDINQMRSEKDQLQKAPETPLFGVEGGLDSLGLVNISVAIERRLEERFGFSKSLLDTNDVDRAKEGFKTVEGLTIYIGELLEKNNG